MRTVVCAGGASMAPCHAPPASAPDVPGRRSVVARDATKVARASALFRRPRTRRSADRQHMSLILNAFLSAAAREDMRHRDRNPVVRRLLLLPSPEVRARAAFSPRGVSTPRTQNVNDYELEFPAPDRGRLPRDRLGAMHTAGRGTPRDGA